MEKFEQERRGDIKPSGSDDVEGRYSDVCEIDAFNVEDGLTVSFSELNFAIEELRSIFNQIRAEISVDDGVASSG